MNNETRSQLVKAGANIGVGGHTGAWTVATNNYGFNAVLCALESLTERNANRQYVLSECLLEICRMKSRATTERIAKK